MQFTLTNPPQTNPDVALVLHTLPAPNPNTQNDPVQKKGSDSNDEPQSSVNVKGKERMPHSAASVPRLISVVEIIKREYLKQLDAVHQDHGKLTGLFQYNEIGSLPDSEPEESARATALQGKNQ